MSLIANVMRSAPIGRNATEGTPSPTDDFWYTDAPERNAAGMLITPDISFKAAVLFSCIRVIAENTASMPCGMYRNLPNGGQQAAPEHPLDELIRFQPNQIQSATEFWETLLPHAATHGTGYAEIVSGQRGAVHELLPLATPRVTPEPLPDGSLRYAVTDKAGMNKRYLLEGEMFRVPGLSSDGITGLRAVDIAAEDLGLSMAADAYAARVFSNRLNIGGYLIHPHKLSPDAQRKLIHKLMMRFAGSTNAHRPMLLQEGMKFERAAMDAEQAQLLEARKWQASLVAMRWRIPLYMLGLGDAKQDSEQAASDFVKYTLRPWCRRIEQAIRRDLITAKGLYFAKFNMDALLRGSSAVRADYFSKALGSGGSPAWLTQNEVRIIEGFNPIDDPRADTLGVGTNPVTDTPPGSAKAEGTPPAMAALTHEPTDTDLENAAKLVRKEVAAIRKANLRFAGEPEKFRAWVTAFYAGHASFVMFVIGIPKLAARAYCDYVRDQVLRANDVGGMLDRWEETRAAELSAMLQPKKEAA